MNKLAIIFLVTILFLTTAGGSILAQNGQTVTDIVVEGNDNVAEKIILEEIETKTGDIFARDKIKTDMQAIYNLGYFQDVQASLQNYNNGYRVIFEVVENPVIKEISISGLERYTEESILEWMAINTGEVLNYKHVNSGLEKVRNKYRDQGYILADFSDVNFSEQGVLNIDFNIGYVNDILIEGNEKTRDFVIEREIDIEKGQILNLQDIHDSYRNLARLNYFEEIDPQLKRVQKEENSADLVYKLDETKTGNLRFGAGYSSRDGWLGFINVQERNLLGRGQNLNFEWQFGETNTYSLGFHEPWLFGYPTSLGIDAYNTKSTSEKDGEEYTEKRLGGSVSLGHALTEQWDGSVKYRHENSEIIWEEAGIDERSIRSVTLRADRDTSNHHLNPTSGARDTISIEYAGDLLGGDNNFRKYNFDFSRYYSGFKEEHAWAVRFKLGLGEGDIPFVEKYRLGGSESLRGYEAFKFDGNEMALMNLEYRFPIADNFTGVLFTDTGRTWDSVPEMKFEDFRHSLGLGVRMNTPIGQIRLDYGWNDEGGGMPHFSIGHTF